PPSSPWAPLFGSYRAPPSAATDWLVTLSPVHKFLILRALGLGEELSSAAGVSISMARFWPRTMPGRVPGSLAGAFRCERGRLELVWPLACLLSHFAIARASADIGVVLNESLDEDFDRISSTGHSAIYFSRICPESPVTLRLCRPGELGSIMSNYG